MKHLDAILSRHGVWSKLIGFKHRKLTSLLPSGDGEAEGFMKTFGKAVCAFIFNMVIGSRNSIGFVHKTEERHILPPEYPHLSC